MPIGAFLSLLKGVMELGKGIGSILKEGEAAKGLLSVEEDSSELINEAETGIKGGVTL